MTMREAKKITFMYLFTEVMETETSYVLFKVFTANDTTMILEILTRGYWFIDSLTYQNDNSNFVSPPPHVLAKLHILKAWYIEDGWLEWQNASKCQHFQRVYASIYNPDVTTTTSRPIHKSIVASPCAQVRPQNKAHEFPKGIKRDKGHYNVLRDKK